MGESYTLPNTNNYSCSGDKTFVGWSTVEVAETDTKPSSNFYEPGEEVTLAASQTFYAVFATSNLGDPIPHNGPSFSRSGTDNTITSGYTLTAEAEAKSGYYQDGSGSTRYLQLLNSNTPIFSSTPNSITITAKIGGGTANTQLSNPVCAQLLDKTGTPMGTATEITDYITTNTGDTYTNISLSTTGITSAYGIRISHVKESGYNVRYYSFSLSYTSGGTTYSAYSTDCCQPLGSINGSVS